MTSNFICELFIHMFGEWQPIIMNWLRVRWYKRKLFEMYVQFMFVFMFFPG